MNPIFCAVDTADIRGAKGLIQLLKRDVGGFKLGLEFFMAQGSAGYKSVVPNGMPVFLDVKLHDIPNTVAGAVTSLLSLQPAFITVHAAGGSAMMRAAAEAAAEAGERRPKLLAVTVLTSLDSDDLESIGQGSDTEAQVVRLGKLAIESGMDGCVCSPGEILAMRAALGRSPVLMVPGIRPSWAMANDQKRTLTPREACDAGASYLVIGRPITKAEDPVEAAKQIVAELN
ncbi:MAG: orotidine-5'-phosphate decarboxylase [Alphaproteobacteria bacterium]|nr:orotidine-5'-phosphate decarboxylase [Alphaproteobacteria bacterium]